MCRCGDCVGLGEFCSNLLYYAMLQFSRDVLKCSSIILKSSSIMPNLSSIILTVNYHKNVLIQHIKPCVELRHSI